jgi:hypothetical protein
MDDGGVNEKNKKKKVVERYRDGNTKGPRETLLLLFWIRLDQLDSFNEADKSIRQRWKTTKQPNNPHPPDQK